MLIADITFMLIGAQLPKFAISIKAIVQLACLGEAGGALFLVG